MEKMIDWLIDCVIDWMIDWLKVIHCKPTCFQHVLLEIESVDEWIWLSLSRSRIWVGTIEFCDWSWCWLQNSIPFSWKFFFCNTEILTGIKRVNIIISYVPHITTTFKSKNNFKNVKTTCKCVKTTCKSVKTHPHTIRHRLRTSQNCFRCHRSQRRRKDGRCLGWYRNASWN